MKGKLEEHKRYVVRDRIGCYCIAYYNGREWREADTYHLLVHVVEFFDLPVEGTGILINEDK